MKIIADDFIIVNPMGIRYIRKVDGNRYGIHDTEWKLAITYKGNELTYSYPNQSSRDSMYSKLREALAGVK